MSNMLKFYMGVNMILDVITLILCMKNLSPKDYTGKQMLLVWLVVCFILATITGGFMLIIDSILI